MSCETCKETYDDCIVVYEPTEDAHREDLMATGFRPEDVDEYLVVRIEGLSSAGLSQTDICPPYKTKAEAEANGWVPKDRDIFLTISLVENFGPDPNSGWGGFAIFFGVLFCCCLTAGIAYCIVQKRQSSNRWESSSSDDEPTRPQAAAGASPWTASAPAAAGASPWMASAPGPQPPVAMAGGGGPSWGGVASGAMPPPPPAFMSGGAFGNQGLEMSQAPQQKQQWTMDGAPLSQPLGPDWTAPNPWDAPPQNAATSQEPWNQRPAAPPAPQHMWRS